MTGSVMAVGVASPAFAASSPAPSSLADNMTTMPTSINGGVDQALAQQPLQKAVDDGKVGDLLGSVTGAAQKLRGQTSADSLLGQTTGAAQAGLLSTLTGAVPGASLLGGLPLGALGGLGH
ncbi:hypothetical protein ACFO3J_21305 [Streptomyces polygonati]|uniref:ATP-binding protein n=1 Tax=Streptomyces polygonati TaxID=1617087 RepID=A0ABV8HPS2_9ACTN